VNPDAVFVTVSLLVFAIALGAIWALGRV